MNLKERLLAWIKFMSLFTFFLYVGTSAALFVHYFVFGWDLSPVGNVMLMAFVVIASYEISTRF